jgi:hypothetical protein
MEQQLSQLHNLNNSIPIFIHLKFSNMKRISLFTHFASAIIVTGIFMTIYATVQQAHRSAANDPQLQLARDIEARINSGKYFGHLLPDDTIDLSSSLATFVTLYNSNGAPIESTGVLDGKFPQLPSGVFDFAKTNKEDVVTWEPKEGVRIATVLESTKNGFVAVGRSLTEVEIRESSLIKMVAIGWLACMGVILAHWVIQLWFTKKMDND